MFADGIRFALLWCYQKTGALGELFERANFLAIGTTGHVTDIDKALAEQKKLKSLNRFEQWLLKPYIEREKQYRQTAFKEAMDDVLGTEEEW